jgi:hypothetical protein
MINKVVVKFKDGNALKGHTSNFSPNKTSFHMEQPEGGQIEIHMETLKAIFFVKDMAGDKNHKKTYDDQLAGGGRKIQVRFLDGETIVGYTMGYSPDRTGFFLVPADSKGNNERIFVVKSATEKVEIMQT